MASTRLPGKPLADIGGKPMIVRVCDLAATAAVGPVLVAAAEAAIADAVTSAGYPCVLTDPDLPSGSDRVHAAAEAFDPGRTYDTIVNLQGDMPTLDPAQLASVLTPLRDLAACDIATLVAPITDDAERTDPNVVKAVLSGDGEDNPARCLYFTRAAAPSGPGPLWHHVGVYAYRRDALARFVAASPSPLERRERLEQLRALELGMTIGASQLPGDPPNGVDTEPDLAAARAHFAARSTPESRP